MTTAHRPTWKAAVGQASEGGWSAGGASSSAVSALTLPSHTKLKVRKGSQVVDRKKALKESLLKLEEAEKKNQKSTILQRIGYRREVSETTEKEGRLKLLKQTAEVDEKVIRSKYNDQDADADDDDDDDDSRGWNGNGKGGRKGGGDDESDDLDASSDEESDDDDSDDSDDDSDEDEEAALQAELAKIRAEREEAKRQKEEQEAAEEEEKLQEAALLGNPLLSSANDGSNDDGNEISGKLKRRWNEDVVFRNQAKGEPKIKKRFINDTVRNDFHKRFLNKFIR